MTSTSDANSTANPRHHANGKSSDEKVNGELSSAAVKTPWILTTIFAALALFVPIVWVGGVIEPAGFVSTIFVAAALITLVLATRETSSHRTDRSTAFLFTVWILLSLVSGTWFILSIVSPSILPNAEIVPMLVARRWASVTLGLAFIYVVARLPKAYLSPLLLVFAVFVVLTAIYGLYDLVAGSRYVLGIEARAEVSWVTGTFGNRNLFAAFMAISIPLSVAVVGSISKYAPPFRWALASIVLAVTGIAVVSSASRLGVAATIVSIAVWAAIVELRQVSPGYRLFVRLSPLALVFAAALWFGMLPLMTRYVQTTSDSGRIGAWSAMFDLPWQSIVVGIGPGQFAEVFPRVQPIELTQHYYYLHNDWLQFFFEFGAIVFIVMAFIAWRFIIKIKRREFTTIQKGALAGMIGGLISASADFPLHVLGTALTYALCIGVILNSEMQQVNNETSRGSNRGKAKSRSTRRRKRHRKPGKSPANVT